MNIGTFEFIHARRELENRHKTREEFFKETKILQEWRQSMASEERFKEPKTENTIMRRPLNIVKHVFNYSKKSTFEFIEAIFVTSRLYKYFPIAKAIGRKRVCLCCICFKLNIIYFFVFTPITANRAAFVQFAQKPDFSVRHTLLTSRKISQ